MSRDKRGQLTLFVILGIVLLMVVGVMVFLVKSFSTATEGVSSAYHDLESGTVREHVSDCAVKVLDDGLERLTRNGGLIYDFEGGRIPYTSIQTLERQGSHITYGIKENDFCPYVSRFSPDYPLNDVALGDLKMRYASYSECAFNHSAADLDGFFGKVNLPKLCNDDSCEVFARGEVRGFTIQSQLQDYVSNNIGTCLDLDGFADKLGAEIRQNGDPVANVTIRPSEILVVVALPLTVTFDNQGPMSRFFTYQGVNKVRFGEFYNFVYDLLSRDSRDFNFDPAAEFISSPRWKEGFEVLRHRDACVTCTSPQDKDDVLEFIDGSSAIKGKPLSFKSAIVNRRPALDLISSKNVDVDTENLVNIPVMAYDPDDSVLNYFFLSQGNGWREDEFPVRTTPDGTFLDLALTSRDLGNHTVAVLAVDDSGFYDYQWFKIDIEGSMPQADSQCVDDCDDFSNWDLSKTVKTFKCDDINPVPVATPSWAWNAPQIHGWYPRISPTGRYVGYGFGATFVTDLQTGVERQFNTPMINHSFTVGWLSPSKFSFMDDSHGFRRFELDVNSWDVTETNDDQSLVEGNRHSADAGHWASWLASIPSRIAYDGKVLVTGEIWEVSVSENMMVYASGHDKGMIELWKDGQPYKTYTAQVPNYERALRKGHIIYGGYGPLRGIDPQGRDISLSMVPGKFEGAGNLFFADGKPWVTSAYEDRSSACNYVFIRPWGASGGIILRADAVHTDGFSENGMAMVAYNGDKGQLTVAKVPLNTTPVFIREPSNSFQRSGKTYLLNETRGTDVAPSCDEFCSLASGACGQECVGGFGPPESSCGLCALGIINSNLEEDHPDCDSFDNAPDACIDHMPDCFWVEQGTSGNCYDDSLLFSPRHPAYLSIV